MWEPEYNRSGLVSVILNCYNGEKYLKEAIDSIYLQSYKNWEIIFWDNLSTDKSAQIAKSYDTKLKYFHGEKHVTLGHARKLAVEASTGEYIAFIDSDDIWFPNKLEIKLKSMIAGGYELCNASRVLRFENTSVEKILIKKNKSGWVFNKQLKQFDVNIQTLIISKKCLDETGLNFDSKIIASEEYCLTMQLLYSYRMSIIKDPLAIYRVRSDSLTKESINFWVKDREYTLNQILINNPEAIEKYRREFKIAFARAKYYKVRSSLQKNDRVNALIELRGIIFADYRYLLLYTVLLFFPKLFNYVISKFSKRGKHA